MTKAGKKFGDAPKVKDHIITPRFSRDAPAERVTAMRSAGALRLTSGCVGKTR